MHESVDLGRLTVTFGGRCFVIAEAGSNHDGRLDQARELIDVAAQAGADAIKFQLFTAEQLYPPNCGIVQTPSGEDDFFALLQRLELPTEWLPELQAHCDRRGILLLFSVFDPDSARAAALWSPAFKIASPELTHLELLREVARYRRTVILSTGMSNLGEIEESLGVLGGAGAAGVALLHCVTAYPAPLADCNLGVIPTLAAAFGVPVGWSDHTLDPIAAPQVAVALGACIVEKHFTLSRTLSGPDHPFAIEPAELRSMVRVIRDLDARLMESRLEQVTDALGPQLVEELRGHPVKRVAESEALLAAVDRRSLHALQDIPAGDTLSESNVGVLRGERNLRPGLHPRHWVHLRGVRAARSIKQGEGVVWDDVLVRSGAN